jgi:hypothetical protein
MDALARLQLQWIAKALDIIHASDLPAQKTNIKAICLPFKFLHSRCTHGVLICTSLPFNSLAIPIVIFTSKSL